MKFEGEAYVCGDHVNTDLIIAGRYCHLPCDEMALHCMEDLDKDFFLRFKKGDIIVAGLNFGCGSSREEAPLALKTAGVSCVIARGFARIFFRNCINIGLPILLSPEAAVFVKPGDRLVVDTAAGRIDVEARSFRTQAFPGFMRKLIERGGLLADARARLDAAVTGTDR